MAALPETFSLLVVPGVAIAVLVGVISTWLLRWLASIGSKSESGGPWEWFDDTLALVQIGLHPDERDDWWQIGTALAGLGAVGAASASIWQAVVLGSAAEAGDWYALVGFLLFAAAVLSACYGWPGPGRPFSVASGLLITYLLALTLALFVPALRAGALSLGQIAAVPAPARPLALSLSGSLGFVAALISVRAALSLIAGPDPGDGKYALGATTALLSRFLQAGWLYASLLTVALLFGSALGSGANGAVLLMVEYIVLLLVMAGTYLGIRRLGAERILISGALPALGLAVVALGLALGGL